jgi:AraC-like DNA-binding protein
MRELGRLSAAKRGRRPVDTDLARQLLKECTMKTVARRLGVSLRMLQRRLKAEREKE